MHRMRLRSGGSEGFAINSQMGVISLALWRVQSARFRSTALLGFPAHKKCCQELFKVLSVDSREHVAVRHLARHALSVQAEVVYQNSSTMSDPVRRSTQTCLSCHLRQNKQAENQRQFVALPLSSSCIR
jgi:hypothetical protein